MKGFGHKRSILLNYQGNPNQEKERLLTLFTSELQNQGLFTTRESDNIHFSRKAQVLISTDDSYKKMLKPLKKGEVSVALASDKRIEVSFWVELKFQLVISLFICFAFGIIIFSKGSVTLDEALILVKIYVIAFGFFFLQNRLKVGRMLKTVKELFETK